MPRIFAALLLVGSASLYAQTGSNPAVSGLVTRVGSPTDFDVDGVHILLQPKASLLSIDGSTRRDLDQPEPFLGEQIGVWGKTVSQGMAVEATKIEFVDPSSRTVSGSAVIDLILEDNLSGKKVRADGRILDLSSVAAKGITSKGTSASPANWRANFWIRYKGVRQPDGTILVDEVQVIPNALEKSQTRLDEKQEYDPAAVPSDSHQSATSKFFRGVNPMQVPPYRDVAAQSRVDRIGTKLIPAYQNALPSSDPTRINFRFQLVDQPKWHDALTLPNGIILVPFQIVSRLKVDDELAAVLADNIGTAIEKQTFRDISKVRKVDAAGLAGDAAEVVLPGAILLSSAASFGIGKHLLTLDEQQSGRVALSLMHDAGFDITKGPEAWWILAAKEGEDPHLRSPPPRAVNQYRELATTWRGTAATSNQTQGR